MDSTDLKTSNPTAKLSRASAVATTDSWHRSVVFHASIVNTPSAKAISESLAKTPGHKLAAAEPTFTKYDLDEDGDPMFQRQSQDESARGYKGLSIDGLLAYKKAVEDHKTRADKVVTLNAAFMKTYVYGTVHVLRFAVRPISVSQRFQTRGQNKTQPRPMLPLLPLLQQTARVQVPDVVVRLF